MTQPPKTPDFEAMRLRMAGLCARSEQCTADIMAKLRRARMPADKAQAIIDFLVAERFIDDARYARAFVRDKVRFSGWGVFKLRAALAAKRIDREAAEAAIGEIDRRTYRNAAAKAAAAKARSLNLETPDDRRKLAAFLTARGYEADLVRKLTAYMRSRQANRQEEEEGADES